MENRQYKLYKQIILLDSEKLSFEYKAGDILVYKNHFSIVKSEGVKKNVLNENYISVNYIDADDNNLFGCGTTNFDFKCILRYNNCSPNI